MIAEEAAAKTPLIKVATNVKTPSSLYSKTKTAATSKLSNIKANLINKFTSSNPAVTPAANKIIRATALNSVTRSIKATNTFNNPTSTRNNFQTPVKATPAKQSNIKTPSTVHTFRTTNAMPNKKLFNSAAKPATKNNATPVTSSNVNINVRKNVSRTVDCAKTAIRRSIRLLNSPPGLSLTPNNPHRRNLFPSGTKIPVMKSVLDRDLSKTDGTHQRTVHLTKNDAKSIKRRSLARRSRLSTGLNEDSCFLITPKLMRQIIDSASKAKANKEIIAENEEDEEEIKIQSIKPSSLLKYLLKDRHEGTSSELESVNENRIEPDQDISMEMEAFTDEVETIAYEKQTSTEIPEQSGLQEQYATKIVSPVVEYESNPLNETIDEPMQEEESTSTETINQKVEINDKPALEKSMSKVEVTQTVLDNIDNLVVATNEINNITSQRDQMETIVSEVVLSTSTETSSKIEEMDQTEEVAQNDIDSKEVISNIETKEELIAENMEQIITPIINNQIHNIIHDLTEVIEEPVLNKTEIIESEPTISVQEAEIQKEEIVTVDEKEPLVANEVHQVEMEIVDQVNTDLSTEFQKDELASPVKKNQNQETQIEIIKTVNRMTEPIKKLNVETIVKEITNQTKEFQALQTKLYDDAIIINDSFEIDEDASDKTTEEVIASGGGLFETQTNLTLETSQIQSNIVKEFLQKVSETPIVEVPIVEVPIVEIPIVEIPIVEEPITQTPIEEEPIVEELIVEEPIVEGPVIQNPIVEETIVEEPVTQTLNVEEPVTEEPIVEEPVTEEPIVEESIVEEPVTGEPIEEEAITETAIVVEPVTQTPIVEELAAETPIIEELVTETPIVQEPIVQVPIVEAITETAIVVEPIVEEPTTEEPIFEEPAVETQQIEELVTETPIVDEENAEQLIETKKTRRKPAAKATKAVKKKPTKAQTEELEEITNDKPIEDTVYSKQSVEPVSSVTCIETQSNLTLEAAQIEKEIKSIEVPAPIPEEDEQPVEIKNTRGRPVRAIRAKATPVAKEPAPKAKLATKETPVAKEPAKRTTKRKQPLDDIQNKNEEAVAVAELVNENDVKKRKYTRKNNKNQEITEEPEKMVIEETPVQEPVVEEVIKPKRVYKKRGAPEPEPIVASNENSKPEVERISTRSQRAKITRKA